MATFSYTMTGTIEVPEGSTLNATDSGIILPNGTTLKVWEQWEQEEADEYVDLRYEDLSELGGYFQTDCVTFE